MHRRNMKDGENDIGQITKKPRVKHSSDEPDHVTLLSDGYKYGPYGHDNGQRSDRHIDEYHQNPDDSHIDYSFSPVNPPIKRNLVSDPSPSEPALDGSSPIVYGNVQQPPPIPSVIPPNDPSYNPQLSSSPIPPPLVTIDPQYQSENDLQPISKVEPFESSCYPHLQPQSHTHQQPQQQQLKPQPQPPPQPQQQPQPQYQPQSQQQQQQTQQLQPQQQLQLQQQLQYQQHQQQHQPHPQLQLPQLHPQPPRSHPHPHPHPQPQPQLQPQQQRPNNPRTMVQIPQQVHESGSIPTDLYVPPTGYVNMHPNPNHLSDHNESLHQLAHHHHQQQYQQQQPQPQLHQQHQQPQQQQQQQQQQPQPQQQQPQPQPQQQQQQPQVQRQNGQGTTYSGVNDYSTTDVDNSAHYSSEGVGMEMAYYYEQIPPLEQSNMPQYSSGEVHYYSEASCGEECDHSNHTMAQYPPAFLTTVFPDGHMDILPGYQLTSRITEYRLASACPGDHNAPSFIVAESDRTLYPFGSRTLRDSEGNPRKYAVRIFPRLPPGCDEHNIQMTELFTMIDFEFHHLLDRSQMKMPDVDQFLPHNWHHLRKAIDSSEYERELQLEIGSSEQPPLHTLFNNPVDAQELFDYLYDTEDNCVPNPTYMYDVQTTVSPDVRSRICDWLVELAYVTLSPTPCVYGGIAILDRFLSKYNIHSDDRPIELWALVSFLIACKQESHASIRAEKLLRHVEDRYTTLQIRACEKLILHCIDYRLMIPTPLDFLDFIVPFTTLPPTGYLISKFILEAAIQQPFSLYYSSSALASAVLFITRFILCTQTTISNNYHMYISTLITHLRLIKGHNTDITQFWHPIFKSFLPFAPLSESHIKEAVRQSWPPHIAATTGYDLPYLGPCVLSICATLVNIMGFGANPSSAFYNRVFDYKGQPIGNIYGISDDLFEFTYLLQDTYTLLYRMNTLAEFGPDCISLGRFIIPVGPLAPPGHSTRAIFVKYTKPCHECISLRFLPPFDLRIHHFSDSVLSPQICEELGFPIIPQQQPVRYIERVRIPQHMKDRALIEFPSPNQDVVLISSRLYVETSKLQQGPFTRYPPTDYEKLHALKDVGTPSHHRVIQQLSHALATTPPELHNLALPIDHQYFLFPEEIKMIRANEKMQRYVKAMEEFFIRFEIEVQLKRQKAKAAKGTGFTVKNHEDYINLRKRNIGPPSAVLFGNRHHTTPNSNHTKPLQKSEQSKQNHKHGQKEKQDGNDHNDDDSDDQQYDDSDYELSSESNGEYDHIDQHEPHESNHQTQYGHRAGLSTVDIYQSNPSQADQRDYLHIEYLTNNAPQMYATCFETPMPTSRIPPVQQQQLHPDDLKTPIRPRRITAGYSSPHHSGNDNNDDSNDRMGDEQSKGGCILGSIDYYTDKFSK